ncbi:MAG TPA: PIN domain-containing protein, partial [Rhizobium sp.]|nr:PIN domain-containing protein [Rhizobium sp.]
MIVLDTNVISELLTAAPNAAVIDWLATQHPSSIFTTAITEAEILYGLRL